MRVGLSPTFDSTGKPNVSLVIDSSNGKSYCNEKHAEVIWLAPIHCHKNVMLFDSTDAAFTNVLHSMANDFLSVLSVGHVEQGARESIVDILSRMELLLGVEVRMTRIIVRGRRRAIAAFQRGSRAPPRGTRGCLTGHRYRRVREGGKRLYTTLYRVKIVVTRMANFGCCR